MSFLLVGESHKNRPANFKIGGIIAREASVRNFRLLAEGPLASSHERSVLLGKTAPSDAYSRFLIKWLNSFSAQTSRNQREAAQLFFMGQAQTLREYLSERQIGFDWPIMQIEPIATTCDFLYLNDSVLHSRLSLGMDPTEAALLHARTKEMIADSLAGEGARPSAINKLLLASAEYLGNLISLASAFHHRKAVFSPPDDFLGLDMAMAKIWKLRSVVQAKNAIAASEHISPRKGGWLVATLTGAGHVPEILQAIENSDSEIAKSAEKKAVFVMDRRNPANNSIIRKKAEEAKGACENLQIEFA